MLNPGRTAILKGGGEPQNVGDVMMRWVAERLIRSLGFETIIHADHGEISREVSDAAGSVEAIFVLGSIQYSDAWPTPTLLERLERSIRFHRHFPRAKVVFLPATWGAFEAQHRDALSELVAGATVLVRDTYSAECINGLLGVQVADYCPDLAFAYPAASPSLAPLYLQRTDPIRPLVGIIPNQRCVEEGVTPLKRPQDYIDFLARIRDAAISRGFDVVGVSHMMNTDRDTVLLKDLGVECIAANDADGIRSVIARLSLCVCSRYHGLVSCLSHGAPVLALGWHHKYRNLLSDFGLGAYHLSVADLPRDPAPYLDQLHGGAREVRDVMAHGLAKAQQLIGARIARLMSAR